MVSKSTLYVFETFLIHHCDQFNHHSQCDYTLEEKDTNHAHMIYCCEDNNMWQTYSIIWYFKFNCDQCDCERKGKAAIENHILQGFQ